VTRLPPWHYRRDEVPHADTLARWRKRAYELAKEAGANTACGICKRPMDQWGHLHIRHPRSHGNARTRLLCTPCAELMLQLIDVLEWFGACDHLPAEDFDSERPREEEDDDGSITDEAAHTGREILPDA